MSTGWSLPPAAPLITAFDLMHAVRGCFNEKKAVEDFIQSIKDSFNVPYVHVVSSGTAALNLSLRVAHAENVDRDLVMIPAYTCYSVPAAVKAAGLTPILCDINPNTLDFDYDDFSERISEHKGRILAVIATHLYGIPSDIQRIRSITGSDGPVIIEDAAQAMGAIYDGLPAGSRGDIGFFSFGRGKALSAVEGGLIITKDNCFAKLLQELSDNAATYTIKDKLTLLVKAIAMLLFLPPSRFWIPMSIPSLRLGETIYDPDFFVKKMSGFQAGFMRDWHIRLRVQKRIRTEKALQWKKYIPLAVTDTDTLKRIDLGALIRYPIFVKDILDRKRILSFSRNVGLGISPGYPKPVSELPVIPDSEKERPLPGANTCAENLITIPNHRFVTSDVVELVTSLIQSEPFKIIPKRDL